MTEDVYSTPKSELETPVEWKRSKWLTAWLWFMLVMTLFNIPATYLLADDIIKNAPKITMPMIYMLLVASVIFSVCLVLLLGNKRIGFYGIMIGGAIVFAFNVYAMGFQAGLTGLIGLAILSFLIFKGGSNSAWSHFS